MSQTSVLQTHVAPDRFGGAVVGSIFVHVAVVAGMCALALILPSPDLTLGGGPGGGQGNDSVSVGMVSNLDGGDASLYKPSLQNKDLVTPPEPPPPKVKEEVKKAVVEEKAATPQLPEERKAPKTPPVAARAVPQVDPSVSNRVPNQTPEVGAGGAPGLSGAGGGIGSGIGMAIGAGDNSGGLLDHWYARQVQRRIGDNWLRSSLQGFQGRRLRALVSFSIIDDGSIEGVDFEERSGDGRYDMAAYRAVLAANPLPALPPEFRGKRIRFIASFSFPIGQ